jgi:hypothetical protein
MTDCARRIIIEGVSLITRHPKVGGASHTSDAGIGQSGTESRGHEEASSAKGLSIELVHVFG